MRRSRAALTLPCSKLTELRPRNPQRFQVHVGWTWDGGQVIYHGLMHGGGYNIGIIHRSGKVIREFEMPEAKGYGHVSTAPDRLAVILDGNVTEDQLCWLYVDRETPRIEPIATHGTECRSVPGQYSHPHSQADPTGRWIAYRVAKDKRTDVYMAAL